MNATIALTALDGGLILERDGAKRWYGCDHRQAIDELFRADDPEAIAGGWFDEGDQDLGGDSLVRAPIGSQEVWACGVTYLRSRDARMIESEQAGGDRFYDMVYDAPRPEIFFKATPHRVVGHEEAVRIRSDSTWDVPEPEFTLAVSAAGRIIGATIGNDMSSRSIEGDNPLYIPQAKVYDGCAALGPRLVLGDLPPSSTAIEMRISRGGAEVFHGTSALDRIVRPFEELVTYVRHDNSFPNGVFVMTGTGIVPGDDFTLSPGDRVTITIDSIGTLVNHVVRGD